MAFRTVNGEDGRRVGFPGCCRGFTFVELMVVMAIVALLLTIAMPRYFDGLQRSREAILRQDLAVMREAIGHYHGDKGSYPSSLETLVEQKYLRAIPVDPVTEQADSWIVVTPPDYSPGVFDVHSGATGSATDGTVYGEW